MPKPFKIPAKIPIDFLTDFWLILEVLGRHRGPFWWSWDPRGSDFGVEGTAGTICLKEACPWRSVGAIFGDLGAHLEPKGDPRVAFWRSQWD